MNKRELVKLLKQNGWVITPGSRHDLAVNPSRTGVKLTIPRHTEPNKYTIEGILKAAGLK